MKSNIHILNNRNVGNDRCISSTVLSHSYKSKGPTKLEKHVGEKLFLRRLYTGSRLIQECPITTIRAYFLIAFSPDGTKFASTNGDHNIYIVEVATNKVRKVLKGHKRTPWTVSFHPVDNNILASGCLSGEVRVWNLEDDSFESWQSPGQTVIASIAFHPKFNLLAVATYKDIYFWDWTTSIIFGQTSTEHEEEKIRYIKFDSTGDKLITAIALKSKMLSQYDSIAFREVFQFLCERRILKDIKLMEKYSENHIHKLQKVKSEGKSVVILGISKDKNLKDDSAQNKPETQTLCNIFGGKKFNLVSETMPYTCIYHYDLVHAFLNVGCFCPTKFSLKVIDILKKNLLPFEYLVDRCYFCRYTLLYNAVFKMRMMSQQKNHICKDVRRLSDDHFNWVFDEFRFQELLEENTNELTGVTEETLRYCFEQFARVRLVPYFSKIMSVEGVCSSNFKSNIIEYEHKDEGTTDMKRPLTHETPLRSDCFLNLCDTFKLKQSGSFVPFLSAFIELYNYLPALQQISTKEDQVRLSMIMTEWEYLYCKLLLINNIVEGDSGLILKRRSPKKCKENSQLKPMHSNARNSFSNVYYEKKELTKCLFLDNQNETEVLSDEEQYQKEKTNSEQQKISDESVNVGASTSAENTIDIDKISTLTDKCKKYEGLKNQCELCGTFDRINEHSCSLALQLLRKDVDILTSEILRRNDFKAQRYRIEKLHKQQLETEINRADGAMFITIQIMKKCIRTHLTTFITELKKLIKTNLSSCSTDDYVFDGIILRLFVFIIKRAVTFSRNILEFLCEYKYNINELTEIDTNSAKPTSSSTLPVHLRHHLLCNFRQNNFEFDEPVFKEECMPTSSDLSDDEGNADLTDNILSGVPDTQFNEYVSQRSRSSLSNQSRDFNSIHPFQGSRRFVTKKVVASRSYINKHVKFLERVCDRRFREDSVVHLNNSSNNSLTLLRNVNLLLYQLRYHSEQNSDHQSNHHPLHRLQMWDFSKLEIPDISNKTQNIVVSECKVHNDATISISHDNTRVAVLLSPNQYNQPDWLGVFSLEWKTLGQILCAVALNQIAVSLSFSPTSQYLVVGFSFIYLEDLKMADVISVQQEINDWRNFNLLTRRSPIATSLIDITNMHRTELIITVNCIKWSPVPGQGLIFGNSLGELKFVV